jgi:hypothetical protein
MPDFKQLAEGERPADPQRYILIEFIHEPAIGRHYIVTGKGLDQAHQSSGDFTDCTLAKAQERAPALRPWSYEFERQTLWTGQAAWTGAMREAV